MFHFESFPSQISISSRLALICRKYQLEHKGKEYEDLPVVFEVVGWVRSGQVISEGNAMNLKGNEVKRDSPVVPIEACIIGPCSATDNTDWNRSVEGLCRIAQVALEASILSTLIPANETEDSHLMKFLWCLHGGVCAFFPCHICHNSEKQGYFEYNKSPVFDKDDTHLPTVALSDLLGQKVAVRFWMHCTWEKDGR